MEKKKGRKKRNGRPVGRPKGRTTAFNEACRIQAKRTGEMPLDYMLRIMRNEEEPDERRDEMAKASAPYLHAKLAAVAVSTDTKQLLMMITQSIEPGEAADMYLQTLRTIEDVSQAKDNSKIIDVKPD